MVKRNGVEQGLKKLMLPAIISLAVLGFCVGCSPKDPETDFLKISGIDEIHKENGVLTLNLDCKKGKSAFILAANAPADYPTLDIYDDFVQTGYLRRPDAMWGNKQGEVFDPDSRLWFYTYCLSTSDPYFFENRFLERHYSVAPSDNGVEKIVVKLSDGKIAAEKNLDALIKDGGFLGDFVLSEK